MRTPDCDHPINSYDHPDLTPVPGYPCIYEDAFGRFVWEGSERSYDHPQQAATARELALTSRLRVA